MKDFKIMEAKILSGNSECHEHKRKKIIFNVRQSITLQNCFYSVY